MGVARQLLLAHPYGQPNVLSSPGIYPDRSVDNRLEPNYDWKGIPALTSSDTKLARVYDDNNVVSTAKVPYMNRSRLVAKPHGSCIVYTALWARGCAFQHIQHCGSMSGSVIRESLHRRRRAARFLAWHAVQGWEHEVHLPPDAM